MVQRSKKNIGAVASWNEKLPLNDRHVGVEEGILLRFFPCSFRVILLGYRVILFCSLRYPDGLAIGVYLLFGFLGPSNQRFVS
jgi:hypothetical protein